MSDGGGEFFRMEPAEVDRVAGWMSDAADSMEAAGADVPGGGDHGLAGALLASMMARFGETGSHLVAEAATLSETVRACHDTTVAADAAAAEAFLITGRVASGE